MGSEPLSEWTAGRRVIVVLGPHRSGTSATTRILNLLGVDLGQEDHLLAPGIANIKGFFEDRAIMELNETLLRHLGGPWLDPPVLQDGWQHDRALDHFRDEAREILETHFGGSPLWGFKDPRTCLTLPFWRELIGEAEYVICHRNMLEVAHSLRRRDGLPLSGGIALWTRHMAASIIHTSGQRRIFVGYEELFSRRDDVIADLAAFVGAPEKARDPDFLTIIEDWLDDDLKHHAGEPHDVLSEPYVSAEARVLHAMVVLAVELRDQEPSLRGQGAGGPITAALEAAAAAFESARLANARRRRQTPVRYASKSSKTETAPVRKLLRAGAGWLDFVVIGAPHAGTEALWDLLHDHPGLSLAPSADDHPLMADPQLFEPTEKKSYASPGDDPLRGLICPQCMSGTRELTAEEFAVRLAAIAPRVKLIAVARHPVQRAVDAHRLAMRDGLERRGVERALREQLSTGALKGARSRRTETNGYVVVGEYARALEIYARHLPHAELLVLLAEELELDPSPVVGRVLRFLNVDQLWRPADIRQRARLGGEQPFVAPEPARNLIRQLGSTVFPLAGPRAGQARRAFASVFDDWNRGVAHPQPALSDDLAAALGAHFVSDGERLAAISQLRIPWADSPAAQLRVPVTDAPEVSIIVPVPAAPENALRLIESLVPATEESYELLLVDNGSDESTRAELVTLAERTAAKLIRYDERRPHAIACTDAIAAARAAEVVLLTADSVVTAGWLSNMRAALHSAPDVAAVGPRSNSAADAQGGIWLDDTSLIGIARFARMFNRPDRGRWFETDSLDTFALLARRAALEEVGGLVQTIASDPDEGPAFGERLRRVGHRLLCAGDSFVFHSGGDVSAPPDGGPSAIKPEALVKLVHAAHAVEAATHGELSLLNCSPACVRREVGADTVWLLHGGVRRRVTGDPHRIRRLPSLAMVEPASLLEFVEGSEVAVEDALPPVPELTPLLPANPAAIRSDRLAGLSELTGHLGEALDAGRGYAMIRLGSREARLLADGAWPVGGRGEVQAGDRPTAEELRWAVIDADAVGVPERRDSFTFAPLLERVLFHLELYPPLCFPSELTYALLGFDHVTGRELASCPLRDLLAGRPVAVVGPLAEDARRYADVVGLDVSLAVELHGTSELEDAFVALAAARDSYDAVIVAAGLNARVLCPRLARELGVVALDLGHALDRLLYPRHGLRSPEEIEARWMLERYLREAAEPQPDQPDPLEGALVRQTGDETVYYIERGAARKVGHQALLARIGGDVHAIEPGEFAELRPGLPVSALRERGTDRLCMLLDGRKVPLRLGLPVAQVDGLELDAVSIDEPGLEWSPAEVPRAALVGGGERREQRPAQARGVYACVVDADPRFHLDALRWYASLTRVAGVDPVDLVIHAVGGTTSEALDWIESEGASIRAVDPFDPRAGYCNKISGALSLAAAGVDGVAVLTDADVAICEDIRSLGVAPSALAMKLVDAENPPLNVLTGVFEAAGIELPPLVSLDFFPERSTAATNGNGGLYVIRGNVLPQVATAWEYWARWLLDRSEALGVVKHADQVAMALALAEAGLEVLHLSARWNLPTHKPTWVRDDVRAPVVLHYHDKVEPSGLISLFGLPAIDERIRTVNEAISDTLRIAAAEPAAMLASQVGS